LELREIETFGEPGAVVYLADCVELMRLMPAGSVDAVFADPPYRLSNGGVTVKGGRVRSVNKGAWNRSLGSRGGHPLPQAPYTGVDRALSQGGDGWYLGDLRVGGLL
jgi:site-specific DNA-methyltransferase (adenine-specific)